MTVNIPEVTTLFEPWTAAGKLKVQGARSFLRTNAQKVATLQMRFWCGWVQLVHGSYKKAHWQQQLRLWIHKFEDTLAIKLSPEDDGRSKVIILRTKIV